MRLRWSLWRAQLDPATGHEQAGLRPVLVISNEVFNRRAGLVTVLPLTTARRAVHPWELLIPAASSGLTVDSILLPHQIRTISAQRLQSSYGRILDPALRKAVAQKVLGHFGFSDMERLAVEE
jgi:mRNA interferase MazF